MGVKSARINLFAQNPQHLKFLLLISVIPDSNEKLASMIPVSKEFSFHSPHKILKKLALSPVERLGLVEPSSGHSLALTV